jgi:hypothetical protein
MGETVARKEPEPIATKLETARGYGIYCGGSTEDDSHLADTPQGITVAKTARRTDEGEPRYDKQPIHAMRGIPADPNSAQAQRVWPGHLAPPAPGPEAAEMRPRPRGNQQRCDAEVENLEVPAAKERADEAKDGSTMRQEPVDQLPTGGSAPPGRAAPSPSVQPAQEGMTETTTDEDHGMRAAEAESAEDPAPNERWVNTAKMAAMKAMGHPPGAQLEVPRELGPSTGPARDAAHGKDDCEPPELGAVRRGITREMKATDKLQVGGAAPRPRGEKVWGAGGCRRREAGAVGSRSAAKQPRGTEACDLHYGNPLWEAIRALLAVALLLRHATMTTDFIMTPMHTPVGDEHEIYEEIPPGYDMGRDRVLRLRRARHGRRKAALRMQELPGRSVGATACVADPTAHYHTEKGTRVAVHTDDPLASGLTELVVNESAYEALAWRPWSTDVDPEVLRDACRSPERDGEVRDGTDSETTGEGTRDGAIDKPWVCPCGCRPADEAALEIPPGRLRCRCRHCRWTPQCWRLAGQGEWLCAHRVGELVPGGDRPPPPLFQNWMACWGSWWSLDGSQQLPRAYAQHFRGQTGRRSDGALPRADNSSDSMESTSLNCEQTAAVTEGIKSSEEVEQTLGHAGTKEVRTVKGPGTESAPDIGAGGTPRAALEACRTMLAMTAADSIGTIAAAAWAASHRASTFLVVWMMTVAGVKGQVGEATTTGDGMNGHDDDIGYEGWFIDVRPLVHIAAAVALGRVICYMIARCTTAGRLCSTGGTRTPSAPAGASASASAGTLDAATPAASTSASASASATAGTPAGAPEAASPHTAPPPTPPCARQRVTQVVHTDSRSTMVHVDSRCQQLRDRSKQLITRSVCSVCSGGLCLS